MSYRTQAAMAKDHALLERVAACAATQGEEEPMSWASDHAWQLSAAPGWDAAYSYAVNAEVLDPGGSDLVVTDGMILSAVQALYATP